jgi:hypothetical protein
LFFPTCHNVIAQATAINVQLNPINIEGFGGIQSFAWGRAGEKILILGGRLDGLHRRQPFAAFNEAGHNTSLIVLDMETQEVWTTSLSTFPVSISEQLSSTNMEFEQVGNTLYLVGGYGFSATAGDHITYPNLIAVDVSGLITAIIDNSPSESFIRQITDEAFRVTGGHLNLIDGIFYLSGGQNFEGRYNPQGPDFGPGFFQEYTNSIRRFSLQDDGENLSATVLEPWQDNENLHRRDYNVVSQIMPDGTNALTIFSGVFRTDADLPYLNSVNVTPEGYIVNNEFAQYYNHYHCATLPFHSALSNEMCTIFFGGIAQYYDDGGVLTQDDNVPFVKTIGMVCRTSSGEMAEYKLQTEMPGLLGAGSEFIPLHTIPQYENGVINFDLLEGDTVLVGYVIGGISSTAANVFFENGDNLSDASSTIYKVYLVRGHSAGTATQNQSSVNSMQMILYPNPTGGEFNIGYNLPNSGYVEFEIRDASGKLIHQKRLQNQKRGEHTYYPQFESHLPDGSYLVLMRTADNTSVQRILLSR